MAISAILYYSGNFYFSDLILEPTTIIYYRQNPPVAMSDDRSLLVRAVWFVFVGWWATGIALGVAWVMNLSVILLPVGIKIINKVPMILSLKQPESQEEFMLEEGSPESPNFLVRGAYFIFIGWWASGLWMAAAYVLSLSIVGIPFAVKMYNKLPYITSLKRL